MHDMETPSEPHGLCARHGERAALGTCARCGDFFCADCADDAGGSELRCAACAAREVAPEKPYPFSLWVIAVGVNALPAGSLGMWTLARPRREAVLSMSVILAAIVVVAAALHRLERVAFARPDSSLRRVWGAFRTGVAIRSGFALILPLSVVADVAVAIVGFTLIASPSHPPSSPFTVGLATIWTAAAIAIEALAVGSVVHRFWRARTRGRA